MPIVQNNGANINIQTSTNQITQQNFLQNNMNVVGGGGSNCQKIQHQQSPHQILTYQTYDHVGGMLNKNAAPQYITQKSEDPILNQVKIERDLLLPQVVNTNENVTAETSVDIPMPIEEPVKEAAAVAGTQKTAEKMRKDEGNSFRLT